MSFSGLHLPVSLDTSTDNPNSSLFIPILSKAVTYDVAVAYFSHGWVRDTAQGIAAFAANGGKSRWIVSPQLSFDDWNALIASKNPSETAESALAKDIDQLLNSILDDSLSALAWLISMGALEFKIGVPQKKLSGLFHPKFGIATDTSGTRIAFTGSYNQTHRASTNWEEIDVFEEKFDRDRQRINEKARKFERLWSNQDTNLRVYVPSDRALKPFVEYSRTHPPSSWGSKLNWRPEIAKIKIPEKYVNEEGKLFEHQENAIAAWQKNHGRGIFSMATGSGKTVTALSSVVRVLEESVKKDIFLFVVIVVPYKHLSEQWCVESELFGFQPHVCNSDHPNWYTTLSHALSTAKLTHQPVVIAIAVFQTFSSDLFQQVLSRSGKNLYFIADEMHHLATERYLGVLPKNAQLRAGFSATPVRYDGRHETEIEEYFGKILIEYGIGEAIRDRTLTPYRYEALITPMTDDEMAEYEEISKKIGLAMKYGSDPSENKSLSARISERNRLIAGLQSKMKTLKTLLTKHDRDTHILIYVGDNSIEEDGRTRAVDYIQKMAGKDLNLRVRKFTASESAREREEILSKFSIGELQALIAIRCLDEGVDVPATRIAILVASNTNPREFIQRRGRVLRTYEGKDKAIIYDFIVVPPASDTPIQQSHRRLIRREFDRIEEFATHAENGGEVMNHLLSIKQKYLLGGNYVG